MNILRSFFIVLFLIQNTFTKDEKVNSSEEEIEMRKNPTQSQKILLHIFDNILLLSKHYAEGAANVSHQVIKDELIASNVKHEIMDFKTNLNRYIEKYENSKKHKELWRAMDIYINTIKNYTHIPEDKKTPESKIIIEVLEKYNYKDLEKKLNTESLLFMDKVFEENKEHINEHMRNVYEKVKNIEDYKKKVYTFMEIIAMSYA